MSPCRYPVSLWHSTHGSLSYVSMQVSCQLMAWHTCSLSYVSMQVCRYPVSLWHGTHGSLSYVSMQVCRYPVSLWHGTHGSLSYVSMHVSCQLMAWHTWFIVLCLHTGMQVSCQLMAWHTWFIVLCLRACILSAYGMAHMVYCLMSPYRYAGILSAYGMAHMVYCLMSPCRYAGILSAYGMALADVVHEAQEPCALIYRSGRYSSLQHFTCLFKNSHEVCVWDKVVVVGGRGVMYINVFLLLLLLISVIRYLCDFKGRTGIKQVAWEQAKQYLNQRHCCLWTLETNNHVPFFQTTLRRLTNVWTTCQCSAWTDWCSKVFPGQFPCLFKEPLVMMMADSFWMRIWEGRGSSVAQHLVDVAFIIGRKEVLLQQTCLSWQTHVWQNWACPDKTFVATYFCHDKYLLQQT